MTTSSFLDNALRTIADSFTLLSDGLADADSFRSFLDLFGWEFDPTVDDAKFTVVKEIFSAEKTLLDKLPGADTTTLVVAIPALVSSLLCNRSPDPQWPAPLNSTVFWSGTQADDSFAREVLNSLLYDIVADRVPFGFGLLSFIGVFDQENNPAVPADGNIPGRVDYMRRTINWEQLVSAISHPEDIFENVYHWSNVGGTFEHEKLLRNIGALFEGFPVGVAVVPTSTAALKLYYDFGPLSPTSLNQLTVLPLSYHTANGPIFGSTKLSLNALPIPPAGTRTGQPVGIAIFPLVTGEAQSNVTLLEGITANLSGAYATIPVLAEIRPEGVTFNAPQDPTDTLNAEARVDARAGAKPWLLLGSATSTRIEVLQAHLSLKANGTLSDPEFKIEVGLDNAGIIVDFGQGDSFLQKAFGNKSQRFELPPTFIWSNKTGFRINGQVGFEVSIAISQRILDVITLNTIFLALRADAKGRITLEGAVTGSFALGPLVATVDRVGLIMSFEAMSNESGNLGMVNLDIGFKPPTGVGLSIDASVIKGGGYLSINDGNYAGILQLEIANKVSITAIGILTTRMPDGTKIFSLKFFGMVEFPPVQLGFGIFLNGVGLVVAIHCSMNAEALKKSVYTGSLSSLLFPPDPIKNAVKIISDLQSFFPPEEDCYAFGVMAKLGWGGVKALVQAEVGVFIELANGKFRKIALAGIAKCILPTDDNQILHIEFQVIGIIDFSNDTFSIDASLEKSFILIFNLDGDIALRACWGDNPRFALSIGGFYPGFVAPNNFPQLRRMSISLGSDNPRIGLLSYMAITENSVQIGAALLFHYEKKTGVGYFEVDGGMGFDALFEFNPFYFETKMYAYLALKRNHEDLLNVRLDLTLSGPNNWHAVGCAKFEVLCVDVTLSFDETFGEKKPEIPPPVVSPLEALISELIDRHNWSVLPPKYGAGKVISRKNAENEPYVDPFGEICFRQKSIPFGINIEKYGNSDINPDECYFEIKPDITHIGSNSAPDVKDEFSPGSYKKLTDQEKISAKAFEQMNSGFKISVDKAELGSNKENNVIVYGKDLCYNTVSPNSGEKPTHGGFVMPQSLINSQFITGQKYYNKFNAKSPSAMNNRIFIREQKFAVISSKAVDGKFKIDNVKTDISYAQAAQLKKNKASTNFHIVCASKAVIV